MAGQTNTLGFTPYLHFQKTTGLVVISNSSVQRVVTDPALPGFQMTIPAGVTITGWDGQPNIQVSIRPITYGARGRRHTNHLLVTRAGLQRSGQVVG